MKLSFAYRLRQIMDSRSLTQADVVRICQPIASKRGVRISVQDISRYCSGKTFPYDDKLSVLADSLGVPEIWLMGYETTDALSKEELDLCSAWRKCTDKERETIAFILRDYGFVLERKITTSSGIA